MRKDLAREEEEGGDEVAVGEGEEEEQLNLQNLVVCTAPPQHRCRMIGNLVFYTTSPTQAQLLHGRKENLVHHLS